MNSNRKRLHQIGINWEHRTKTQSLVDSITVTCIFIMAILQAIRDVKSELRALILFPVTTIFIIGTMLKLIVRGVKSMCANQCLLLCIMRWYRTWNSISIPFSYRFSTNALIKLMWPVRMMARKWENETIFLFGQNILNLYILITFMQISTPIKHVNIWRRTFFWLRNFFIRYSCILLEEKNKQT